MKVTPLRIALVDSGGPTWTGGLTYRRNLLQAMKFFASDVQLYRFTEQELSGESVSNYCQVIQYSTTEHDFTGKLNRLTTRLSGNNYALRRAVNSVRGGVDLIFPCRDKIGKKTASLFWIPDFQFLHFPQMYSKTGWKELHAKYRQGASRATLVVLSSQAAGEDFIAFSPEHAQKARVLNFTAHVPTNLYEVDPGGFLQKYNLRHKFVYLPNQFWAHKNHMLVLEALVILAKRNIRPFIVMTGNPVDSRNPLFFADFMQKISLHGLREQIAILGLVPHDEVYSLIRQSVCVFNPSLFEGWSTSVEEARSVGKRVLLSDIPVHREQNPPGAVYFDPRSPEDLAEKLATTWKQGLPGPDLVLEGDSRRKQTERMKDFGAAFLLIAREAVRLVRGQAGSRVAG